MGKRRNREMGWEIAKIDKMGIRENRKGGEIGGNGEPRLASNLGHFWRQMDWPGFPPKFWASRGKLTFLTSHHFEL